jgi:hypothetical protein
MRYAAITPETLAAAPSRSRRAAFAELLPDPADALIATVNYLYHDDVGA